MAETAYTCTVIKDGTKIYRSVESGICPLIHWLRDDPTFFEHSYVIDKVIGKASALLLIYGKAAKVHGQTMSQAAEKVLQQHQIEYSYDQLVDHIENRDHTGMCPMEQKVINIDSAQEAFELFDNLVQ